MNIEMIRAAAKRLDGHVVRTPLLSSPFLDQIAGRRVLIKPECLQRTGSFKFRGAWSAISALDDATRQKGVLAFSSGNHAQGIAYAAKLHECPATIVMPSDAPKLKIDNTRAYGAEVILYDRSSEDRDAIGTQISQDRGLTMIKPFDDPLVIAGQGTCGLEIAQQAADMGITQADVIVCCGGGGLTSGIALALEADAPDMTVRPAEPEAFDDVARSLRSGQIERNATTSGGLCDSIITPSPGQITFPILHRLCGPGLVVSDEEVLQAMALAFQRLKIVSEPGGIVALAAALFHGSELTADTAIVTVSGGNVDPDLFTKTLQQYLD